MTVLPTLRRACARALSLIPHRAGSPANAPRRRALRTGALATVLVVLAGGSLAVASAHKTVTLDVDGRSTEVSTFAGSIAGLIQERGIDVGRRDVVAPDPSTGLRDGSEVVVRFARQLTVLTDGQETTVWTTAPSAQEALGSLAARGQDVRLVTSRSAATGRADLGLRLTATGPVDVVVDGRTHHVADASVGLEDVLASLGLTVGPLDRVQVHQPVGQGSLTVLVQRVTAQEVTSVTEAPFQTVTQQSADLYAGQQRTTVAGVPGELSTVHRVILVDGVEESRRVVTETVIRPPVDAVVVEGTRRRPVAAAGAVGGDVWSALARCESGGNPRSVSANGLYYGLYQFSVGTWQAMGGTGLPSDASPEEQTQRAQALQARSGWGQWPACSVKLGLR